MKNKKMTRMKFILFTGLMTIMLVGCGNAVPDLTEDQSDEVAQAAVDLLLSTKDTNTRLVDTEEEGRIRAEKHRKEREIAEKIKQNKEALKNQKSNEENEENGEAEGETQQEEVAPVETLSSISELAPFLGLDELTIQSDGYTLTESYMDEAEDGEWAPYIDATSGNKLFVVHLIVQNPTDHDVAADVASMNTSFRLMADGKYGGSSLLTMLLSDFSIMKDTIPAGASKNYVLITQVPGSLESVSTIKLVVQKDDNTLQIGL